MNESKRVLEKIRADRGEVRSWRETLAPLDPTYLELSHDIFMHVMEKRKAISRKNKELMVMAIDAAVHYVPGVKVHMTSAKKFGATKDEVVEALEVASLVTGVHALSLTMPVLQEVYPDTPGRQMA
ncbi:MAG: carboxymuconolactone decarboxylase family protein [Chloroflexi bacterium]|nr:carboxymuconolactone decarboxylase family protein [Chloroflexota bacterium]